MKSVGQIDVAAMRDLQAECRTEFRTLAGVDGTAYESNEGFANIQAEVEAFATAEGLRPCMLVVKMGQNGHDRGATVIATGFADIGFGFLFNVLNKAAVVGVENDIHIRGVSSQAASDRTLGPKLVEALRVRRGRQPRRLRRRALPAGQQAALQRGRERYPW